MEKIMEIPLIVDIAKKRFSNTGSQIVHFLDDEKGNLFLNNIKELPHAFVLACLMDRQIKAERAWAIPFEIFNTLGTFSIDNLSYVKLSEFRKIFNQGKLHRFNDTMANVFHDAIRHIVFRFNGDASKIWSDTPSSASVVYRFMEFKGSGVKISTMAANILARQFRIPFSDYYSIGISPDVHILRVMKRMGFVDQDATVDMVIYKARELNPDFPGIIDFSCWEIGRTWCKPKNPECSGCIVNSECKRIINTAA
jgi:endonuclease III